MNANKNVLYHISRENQWTIGDTIIAGKRDNPFWITCKNYSPQITIADHTMTVFEMIQSKPPSINPLETINLLYRVLDSVSTEFSFFMREQAFEDYRRLHFPSLPSRQNCLWVSESDQLAYWKTMESNKPRSILTLELDGDLFCADEQWLTKDTLSYADYWERASHYWTGNMTTTPRKEFLFSGTAIIKEIHHFT